MFDLNPLQFFPDGLSHQQQKDHIGNHVGNGIGNRRTKSDQIPLKAPLSNQTDNRPDDHDPGIKCSGKQAIKD